MLSHMHQREVARAVGKNLRKARSAAGLTVYGLADKSGIHVTSVSRYETGRHLPQLVTLLRLSAALGAGVETLLEGVAGLITCHQ